MLKLITLALLGVTSAVKLTQRMALAQYEFPAGTTDQDIVDGVKEIYDNLPENLQGAMEAEWNKHGLTKADLTKENASQFLKDEFKKLSPEDQQMVGGCVKEHGLRGCIKRNWKAIVADMNKALAAADAQVQFYKFPEGTTDADILKGLKEFHAALPADLQKAVEAEWERHGLKESDITVENAEEAFREEFEGLPEKEQEFVRKCVEKHGLAGCVKKNFKHIVADMRREFGLKAAQTQAQFEFPKGTTEQDVKDGAIAFWKALPKDVKQALRKVAKKEKINPDHLTKEDARQFLEESFDDLSKKEQAGVRKCVQNDGLKKCVKDNFKMIVAAIRHELGLKAAQTPNEGDDLQEELSELSEEELVELAKFMFHHLPEDVKNEVMEQAKENDINPEDIDPAEALEFLQSELEEHMGEDWEEDLMAAIAKGNAFLNEGKGSGPHKGKGPKPKKD